MKYYLPTTEEMWALFVLFIVGGLVILSNITALIIYIAMVWR